jgi:hypothetical protein
LPAGKSDSCARKEAGCNPHPRATRSRSHERFIIEGEYHGARKSGGVFVGNFVGNFVVPFAGEFDKDSDKDFSEFLCTVLP